MYIIDSETLAFIDVNNAALKYYGYSKTELLQMNLADIRAATDNPFFLNKLRNCNDQSFCDLGISSHRKNNGDITYVHVFAHQVVLKGNSVQLISILDENDKIVAEKKNKELSEIVNVQAKRLDYVLSNIDDVVWGTWADTHELIFTNKACEKIYGYTEEEMMADKGLFFNSIHVDDRAAFYSSSNRLLSTGRADFEFRVIHRNGSVKYLRGLATVMKGENGEPDICCGLNIDITKEKELQSRIETNELNLRSLIDNTNDYIWSVDVHANLIIFNQSFKNFIRNVTGKDPQPGDCILMEVFGDKLLNEWREFYKRAIKGEHFVIVDKYLLPDATEQYVEISFNPIRATHNEITGVSCMARDIPESLEHLLKLKAVNSI